MNPVPAPLATYCVRTVRFRIGSWRILSRPILIRATSSTNALRHALACGTVKPGPELRVTRLHILP